ncbi:MAG TPA: hypothetical protein VMQ61_03220 [Thermoanaerobaculia bacterium]|nr:hypothetical protein [Thermoanaerobaculia bacterium]
MNQNATAPTLPPPREVPAGHRVTWSGLALTFSERTLNALVRGAVAEVPELNGLRIQVTPGELALTAVVHRFGVPLSAKATVSQLRLKDGFLAFVLDRVQALSFIPIPDQLLTYLVQKAPPGLLTYYREDRIMVVNLNDWMPPGVDLSLERTEFGTGELTLHFAPGSYDLAGLIERVGRAERDFGLD